MTVYHMGEDGTPKPCKAMKNCPLGGEHFNSLPEARTYSELMLAQEALKRGADELEERFSVAQRRRMWLQNPKMSYVHPVGTVLISKRGDLWELAAREQTGGQLDHRFTLVNRRSGKKVTVSTGYQLKEGERSPDDFAQLNPRHFTVDGPPLREGNQLKELPEGKLSLENVLIAKIRVRNVENELDKSKPRAYDEFGDRDKDEERRIYGRSLEKAAYRYLIIPNSAREKLNDPDSREIYARALWAQAGRDEESWERLSPQERSNLMMDSKAVKKATFFTKNGTTNYTNGDLREDQFDSFWMPGGTPTSGISLLGD